MKMTTHANIRQQQRGIPLMIIDLLRNYGSCESAGDGTTKYYFDKGSKRKLKTYAGQLASLLEEHLNCYLIVCPEGTCYYHCPSNQEDKTLGITTIFHFQSGVKNKQWKISQINTHQQSSPLPRLLSGFMA